jgi:chemotaxis protein histidine kinase CheA/ActR/RegA family two-component response regulator
MLEENLLQFGLAAADAMDELWGVMSDDVTHHLDAGAAEPILNHYAEVMRSIGATAASSNLDGLQSACAAVEANVRAMVGEKRSMTQAEIEALTSWPEHLLGYVMSNGDRTAGAALVGHLSLPAWPSPMKAEDAEILQYMLYEAAEEMEIPAGEEEILPPPPAVTAAEPAAEPVPPSGVQRVEGEMLSMLGKEFARMDDQLVEDLAAVVSPQLSADDRRAALANYTELLERLAVAAEAIGLTALSAVFARLVYTLSALTEEVRTGQYELLKQLPGRVTAYLDTPSDERACSALIDMLSDPEWRTPVDMDSALLWVKSLANLEIVAASEEPQVQRQTEASPEDVSLALPEDLNSELLDGLLQELPVQTAAFTAAIERLAAGQGSGKDVERAMRAAHTLKGAANTVGVRGIANLTHHVEDILSALHEAGAMPDHTLAGVLTNAGDCLEAMSEALMGLGSAPEQAQAVLQEVLDSANHIDHEGVSAAMPAVPQEAAGQQPEKIAQQGKPEMQPSQVNVLRVPSPVVDELLRLAGETLISNSQIHERLRLTTQQSAGIKAQLQSFQHLVTELEQLVDVRGVGAEQEARVKGEMDPLEFERFSELHTVTRRLIEAANDAQQMQAQVNEQLHTLDELLQVQQRLQTESHHAVIRTRLVPVSSVASRLQRSVRQTCRLLDKQVTLEIKGDNTSIDSNVLNELIDPLMHVLRNAVDHGIEAPGVRVAQGKPAVGKIELSFAREGNSIVVRCTDDGAGLDYPAIWRIAESKGLLASDQEPSPDELARLILISGFSTREDATQVSGRGVGMDAVYNRVLDMKGTLALNSARGAGLSVELRLPATLLSAHTLVVRHRDKLIAVSSHGVEDIHFVTVDQIEQVGNLQYYRAGDAVHTLVKLENLLDLPEDRREEHRLGFPVLLTRTDNGAIKGVLVQEVLNGREVVLKNFGRYVPKIQGTVGAVILGDGSVAPVVDLVELLRTPAQYMRRRQLQAEKTAKEEGDSLTALVVDDSLSARRAASKLMQDAGYKVRTAIDGLEAVSILQGFVPSVMLVDMEMPRMNGIELTAHMRDSARTRDVPVIMITSRSTEKHRQMGRDAGVDVYLTKPFSDDVLIDHVERLVRRGA